jgi:uncharacterized 2Fe-2S/4Fe-4S cluster protein (DUF4445 family)
MSPMVKILPGGTAIEARRGGTLSDALEAAGFHLSLYCGRRGLCGKCFVEIVRGPIPEPTDTERSLLRRRKLPHRFRLACGYRIEADTVLRLPAESMLPEMPVFTRGIIRSVGLAPAVKKISYALSEPGLNSPPALLDLAKDRFPEARLPESVEALRRMAAEARLPDHPDREVTAVLYNDRFLLAVEKGDTTGRNYGLAVDLGTTTIVVEIVDLNTGAVIGTEAGMNGQARFGADVISRIAAAYGDPERTGAALRTAVVDGLNQLIDALYQRTGIRQDSVYEAVIAGNTAMNHLFLGLPVDTLAVAPFYAAFSILPAVPAEDTGLRINPRGRVYIAPNIKSYVGGDISAGLSAIDLEHRSGNFVFIDLGTNGEIVLKKAGKMVATSTAAGPAFEGMTISRGMLALPGAIYRANLKDGSWVVRTIAAAPARGICGTGLIDIVALSLKHGRITPRGHILDPDKKIMIGDGLFLDQKDIREIQLAAAAVKTGIRMLLAGRGMTVADLDGVFVAGAFGNYLNIRNATAIGLLPRIDPVKIFFVGNASLAGARALLLNLRERIRCERLAGRIGHVSLAMGEDFQKTFIEALNFEAWS